MNTENVQRERNCVLLIDDDSMNREMLRQIFEEYYDAVEAENGLEGLQKLEQQRDRVCAVLLSQNHTGKGFWIPFPEKAC